jgi:hypothetical protein
VLELVHRGDVLVRDRLQEANQKGKIWELGEELTWMRMKRTPVEPASVQELAGNRRARTRRRWASGERELEREGVAALQGKRRLALGFDGTSAGGFYG